MEKDQLIFRITRLIRAIEESSGLDAMDLSARAILNFVGEAEARKQLLNVSDVVRGPGFGTPPTVYSRIAELEHAGWIRCVPDPEDGRAKHVRLTPQAHRAFSRMSAATRKLIAAKG
ncbi:MarR family winged helix-turn-helix transcriptional regulator [Aestuariivirga sp.]|uniref:MarR family winged helix-turn-helix transcriptional regulator n=1 Tax=Aestuariivirga sp. TaxID=2650926 RepID=UPI00391ABD80